MIKAALIASLIVVAMWISFLVDWVLPADFATLGILPRHLSGLVGILRAPFIHGNWSHLISNTGAIWTLSLVLFWFYDKIAWKVWFQAAIMDGALVWLLARTSYHIGMSGVIFALLGFLLAIGIFRFSIKTLVVATIVFFLYGGAIWGVLPSNPHVSWEAHLFGFVSGILIARWNRKNVD